MSLVLFCERPSRRKEEEKFLEALGSWRATKETILNNEALRRRYKKILKLYINNVIVIFVRGKSCSSRVVQSRWRTQHISKKVFNTQYRHFHRDKKVAENVVNFLIELQVLLTMQVKPINGKINGSNFRRQKRSQKSYLTLSLNLKV